MSFVFLFFIHYSIQFLVISNFNSHMDPKQGLFFFFLAFPEQHFLASLFCCVLIFHVGDFSFCLLISKVAVTGELPRDFGAWDLSSSWSFRSGVV